MEARVLNKQQLRAAVLRDLAWLFNTARQEPDPLRGDPDDVARWADAPWARRSVLNFGIPSLSGIALAVMQFPAIEAAIRQAILRFEPRIDPKTLKVEIVNDRPRGQHEHAPGHQGHLWNQPVPLELLLGADVNVDTGQASVRDMRD